MKLLTGDTLMYDRTDKPFASDYPQASGSVGSFNNEAPLVLHLLVVVLYQQGGDVAAFR